MMEFSGISAQKDLLRASIESRIAQVLSHGQFIMGPEIQELERTLSSYTGAAHAITCSSGTDALLLALIALGIGEGDGVFLPSYTFAATAEAVLRAGATPLFVDVDPHRYTLDPQCLREAVEHLQSVKNASPPVRAAGVVAVDIFGHPADYDEIQLICDEYNLKLLSDGAQSFGARYRGRISGNFSDCTATSFFPSKPLGCYGDGGAIFCNSAIVADKVRALRVHGRTSRGFAYIGMNGRLDTIQAAVLLEKMSTFDQESLVRRRHAELYRQLLPPWLQVPTSGGDCQSSWSQFNILLPVGTQIEMKENRTHLVNILLQAGIPTRRYYGENLHRQTLFTKGRKPILLPVTESLAERGLCLPIHGYLSSEKIEAISHVIRGAF